MGFDLQEYLQSQKEAFKKELEAKTGWGRNEVLAAYERAVKDSLISYYTKGSK